MLHENLGEAHRKHVYQLMANELKIGHVTVSLIYMGIQLAISLGFIYLIPNTIVAHWVYLVGMFVVLAVVAVAQTLFSQRVIMEVAEEVEAPLSIHMANMLMLILIMLFL